MPPRIRTRASKALKENINVTGNKLRTIKNNIKAPRKALADKTNSASDDASLEIPTKPKKTIAKSSKTGSNKKGVKKQILETIENKVKTNQDVKSKENYENHAKDARPRRERKLPSRFVENTILNNLSNSKDNSLITPDTPSKPKDNTPAQNESISKSNLPEPSPFKTPAKADTSLVANRPRRICRLPSRLEDHSISPNKFIPIQPAHASTPIQNKTKPILTQTADKNVGKNLETKKQTTVARPTRLAKINALQKESSDNSSDKSSPDSNNNGRSRKKTAKTQSNVTKKQSTIKTNQSPIRKFFTPVNKTQTVKKPSPPIYKTKSPLIKSPIKITSAKKPTTKKGDKNLSFKLLGSKKTSQEEEKNDLDVYEFTFDPNEEPKPQKKKRKRTVSKKPADKPKKVVHYKSSYDQNISKALAALKNAVKPSKTAEAPKLTQISEHSDEILENVEPNNPITNTVQNTSTKVINENNMILNDTGKTSVHECNYPSIRVEDIAADIEPSMEHHDDINYSPVNSPRPALGTPNASVNHRDTPEKSVHNNDPLNLIEELSFFDEQPVASSSMNMSARHPLASPWRVEFGSLPIKWHVNTYVKPNMTPAVESSFINPEDSGKKKHVYTNMVPETNEMFTNIADTTPNLKQTSIISFIKEMAEKSLRKKRGRSVSPSKAVQELVEGSAETHKTKKSSKKADPTPVNTSEEISSCNDTSTDKENSKEEKRTRKRKNDENICDLPAKSPRKQNNKDTFFGFDESENQDENVSPVKVNNPKGRSLRPRSRAVLQEINGPTRAVLPVAAKTKIATSSEAVNRVYEELKSAADAPLFPEKNVDDNVTNVEPSMNEDSQSVHLFEDIEFVHHLKPLRKSYGKAKKVTFRQGSSDSDTQDRVVVEQNESSDYDDLADLTFEIPNVQEKKVTKKKKPKKQRTKKEEQEAEAWAANFNSMCEDIEEFPLLVE